MTTKIRKNTAAARIAAEGRAFLESDEFAFGSGRGDALADIASGRRDRRDVPAGERGQLVTGSAYARGYAAAYAAQA